LERLVTAAEAPRSKCGRPSITLQPNHHLDVSGEAAAKLFGFDVNDGIIRHGDRSNSGATITTVVTIV
jgi:hypothetical protein